MLFLNHARGGEFLVATKQKTSSTTKKMDSTNMMAVSFVVGLVLFGLGYVVGKTKAQVKAEAMYAARMSTIRQELMGDQSYRKSFMEKMMGEESLRNDLFKTVDEYRTNMKRQMMYRN